MKTNMRKISGFTLIEILIAVAIVAILAAVAVPAYQGTVQKSRRTDARNALTTAAAIQERLYSQNQSYATQSELNKLVSNSDGESSDEGFYEISVSNADCSGPPYNCFTITATTQGAQLSDSDCASFSIDHLGRKTSAPSGDCW